MVEDLTSKVDRAVVVARALLAKPPISPTRIPVHRLSLVTVVDQATRLETGPEAVVVAQELQALTQLQTLEVVPVDLDSPPQ